MSARAFMHIDEYGAGGFRLLPHAVCMTSTLVLWAPSARLLAAARRSRPSLLEPSELLNLVDRADAPVRVVAREQWFDRAWRDRHPFPGAHWVNGYDDALKRMAEEDRRRELGAQRVIIAPAERGRDAAQALLESPAARSLRARVGRLYRNRRLPEGYLEKADRLVADGEPYVETVLRDFANHRFAQDESGASMSVAPLGHLATQADLQPGTTAAEISASPHATSGPPDAATVRDAIRILRSVRPVLSTADLRRFLKSGLREDLHELMYSERGARSLEHHVAGRLEAAIELPPIMERLFPRRDPVTLTRTLSGYLLAIASAAIAGNANVALIGLAYEFARGPAIERDLIPAPVDAHRPARSLLLLHHGTTRPVLSEVRRTIAQVRGARP